LTFGSLLTRLDANRFYQRRTARGIAMEEFETCWEGLQDPRTGNAALHDFHDLLTIALYAVLAGGENATGMTEFAKAKEPFLRGILRLPNGLPSHDTFSRLFRLLDPKKFEAAFQQFMVAFSGNCRGVVAIDGKVLRRSYDKARGKSPYRRSVPGAASNRWN
jgi:hypothetical protein